MVFSHGLDCKRVLAILIAALLLLPASLPILKVQGQTGASEVQSTSQAQIIVNPNQGKRGDIIEITLTNQVIQIGSLVTPVKPDGVIILMRDVGEDGRLGLYGEFHLIPAYVGDVQPDWVEIQSNTWRRSYYVYAAAMEGPNIISCGDLQTPFTVLSDQPTPKTGTIVPKDLILNVYPTQSNVTELEVFSEGNSPVELSIEENVPSYLKILIDPQAATPSGGITRFQLNVTLDCSQTQKPDLPSDYNLTVKAKSGAWETSAALTLRLLPAKWLIMIYLVADNDLRLGADLINDEIGKAAMAFKTPKVSVIILFNGRSGEEEVCRMLQWVDGDCEIIGDWGPTNMSSPNTLRRFIMEATSKIPAEHTHLVLYDHGEGVKGALQDTSQSNRKMSVSEMGKALEGVKFDVVSFDACLMAEVEVLYHLRSSADYFTCSELKESAVGYAYQSFLQDVLASPELSVKEYLKSIVNNYVPNIRAFENKFRREYPGDITLSAIDSSKLEFLATRINALSQELRRAYLTYGMLSNLPANFNEDDLEASYNWTIARVVAASSGAVGSPLIDIGDLANRLAAESKIQDETLKQAAQDVASAVRESVVVSTFSEGQSVWPLSGGNHVYYGLTIFLWRMPPSNPAYTDWLGNYRSTSFASETSWETFVDDFVHSWEFTSVLVRLDHPAHELYVHVYDDCGRHVGFNASSMGRSKVDLEISGVMYTEFSNGTEILEFPTDTSQFRVVVDGFSMEESEESYTLTLSLLANGTEITKIIENTIKQNTTHTIPVNLGASGFEVGTTVIAGDGVHELFALPVEFLGIISAVLCVAIVIVVIAYFAKKKKPLQVSPPSVVPPTTEQAAISPSTKAETEKTEFLELPKTTKTVKCLNCGSENRLHAKFCVGCGASIQNINESSLQKPRLRYCLNCGSKLTQKQKFCMKCGTKID